MNLINFYILQNFCIRIVCSVTKLKNHMSNLLSILYCIEEVLRWIFTFFVIHIFEWCVIFTYMITRLKASVLQNVSIFDFNLGAYSSRRLNIKDRAHEFSSTYSRICHVMHKIIWTLNISGVHMILSIPNKAIELYLLIYILTKHR